MWQILSSPLPRAVWRANGWRGPVRTCGDGDRDSDRSHESARQPAQQELTLECGVSYCFNGGYGALKQDVSPLFTHYTTTRYSIRAFLSSPPLHQWLPLDCTMHIPRGRGGSPSAKAPLPLSLFMTLPEEKRRGKDKKQTVGFIRHRGLKQHQHSVLIYDL